MSSVTASQRHSVTALRSIREFGNQTDLNYRDLLQWEMIFSSISALTSGPIASLTTTPLSGRRTIGAGPVGKRCLESTADKEEADRRISRSGHSLERDLWTYGPMGLWLPWPCLQLWSQILRCLFMRRNSNAGMRESDGLCASKKNDCILHGT
jgi:hypothetical protein